MSANELFGDETIVFNNVDQKCLNFWKFVSTPQKYIEQYDFRIIEKDAIILLLNDKIQLLEKIQNKK